MSARDLNRCGPDREWTPAQVALFVRRARERHEHAWELIPNLRDAILAEEFASVVTGVGMGHSISGAALRLLWQDMLARAHARDPERVLGSTP